MTRSPVDTSVWMCEILFRPPESGTPRSEPSSALDTGVPGLVGPVSRAVSNNRLRNSRWDSIKAGSFEYSSYMDAAEWFMGEPSIAASNAKV